MRPKHVLRCVAEEIPIVLRGVGVFEFHRREGVLNLRREQVAMLIPDLVRRALQVDVGPAALLKAVSTGEAGVCRGHSSRWRVRIHGNVGAHALQQQRIRNDHEHGHRKSRRQKMPPPGIHLCPLKNAEIRWHLKRGGDVKSTRGGRQ